jgi:hypothetical protein
VVARAVKASRLVRPPSRSSLCTYAANDTHLVLVGAGLMSSSQEQKSRIFPMDLTAPEPLRMMWKSSARRRRGLTRDVLRTSVPADGQPSQRAGWGATARAGGLPAAVADPVGPRAGHLRDHRRYVFRPMFSSLDRRLVLCDYSPLIRDPEWMMDHDIWFG